MTSRELQIILTELRQLGNKMDNLEIRVGGLEGRMQGLEARMDGFDVQLKELKIDFDKKHYELRDLVVSLAEDQAATQETINMFIVQMSRHDEDLKMLKTKVAC